MTPRAKNRLELTLRVPLLSRIAPGRKTSGSAHLSSIPSGHFGGSDTEVKPFENQMNNERRTSGISLHDFNELEGHRLRGLLNVEENENSWSERN